MGGRMFEEGGGRPQLGARVEDGREALLRLAVEFGDERLEGQRDKGPAEPVGEDARGRRLAAAGRPGEEDRLGVRRDGGPPRALHDLLVHLRVE